MILPKRFPSEGLDQYVTRVVNALELDEGAALGGEAVTLLSALVPQANTFPYFTTSGMALASLTSFARTLLDDSDATTARTTLGLGTVATQAASAVALTGGTVNGITIGGTTPAAGTFTTATMTTLVNQGGVFTQSIDADAHSFITRKMFEPTNAAWATVLTITPASVTSVYTRGYVEFDFAGDTGGVGNGITRSLWYFNISNGAPTVANFGTDVTSGTGAAQVRLNVSGNAVQVQIQSSDGIGALGGTLLVTVRCPKPSGNATTFTLS